MFTEESIIPPCAAKTLLQRRIQREQLSDFFLRAFAVVNPGVAYKHNWHVDLICEYLEATKEGEIQKLIINIPPRSLKSNIVTVAFPAWGLGLDPSERFLCQSYSSKLSIKHSVDTRLIIESSWYKQLFPETIIAADQNEKTKFQTTARGHRIATSIGGTATGEGGNYLITDDPINPKQAMSDADRISANEWMDQVWSSRKDDPDSAVEIMVMQRLHVDDPTGHLLAEDKSWTHLVIPQEAESRTTIIFPMSGREFVRERGDLIQPDRVSESVVAEFKVRLGSYGWSAQHQQRPAPAGGGIVRVSWFQRYKTPPAKETAPKIRISLDTGAKDKEVNDPSVAGIWFSNMAGHYLVDIWKDRVVYPDLKRTVIGLLEKWRPNECLIEDKGSGQQLIQDLLLETNFAIIPMEPKGIDKVTRMANESPVIEAGQVWLPEQAEWLFDYEQEMMNFPNVTHDDQVDMTSQFLKRARAPSEIFIG
jgi:predicted phage terminase large subunit-like protein